MGVIIIRPIILHAVKTSAVEKMAVWNVANVVTLAKEIVVKVGFAAIVKIVETVASVVIVVKIVAVMIVRIVETVASVANVVIVAIVTYC